MKPFNLEKALAGAEVVQRNGDKVTNIHYFAESRQQQKLYAMDGNGDVNCYSDNGSFFSNDEKSDYDLFLAGEKKRGWIIIRSNGGVTNTFVHASEQAAKEFSKKWNFCGSIGVVEWEE